MSIRSSRLVLVCLIGVLLTATRGRAGEATFAPSELDLGRAGCDTVVRVTAWLVNTGDVTLTVRDISIDCLYVTWRSPAPRTVAPGCAKPLELSVTVPSQPGARRSWPIKVTFADGGTAVLPVHVEPSEIAAPFAGDDSESVEGLRFVPATVDVGALEPASRRIAVSWLINGGFDPVAVQRVKPSCSCITVEGFEAGTLPPGAARRLEVILTAPAEVGKIKHGRVTVIRADETGPVLRTWVESVDPLVARLERYRDARRRHDVETQRQLLADDARLWFESREGPGTPIGPGGEGPWAGWDREMGASVTGGDPFVDGRSVTRVTTEINDYYRLLDRPGSRLQLTYWFDEDRRIEGRLVEGLDRDERDRGRSDEFTAWAEEHHPEEMERLLDGDRIVPSAVNARRWRWLLLQWRREVGLSIPRMPEWEARLDATLQRYLTARDFDVVLATTNEHFRLWFERRTGPGLTREQMRDLFEWDRACGARVECRELVFEGERATGVFHETSEFARLLGFPGRSAQITFSFDENGLIAGRLYEPMPGPSFDEALEPALRWLQQHRPTELAEVYVDGRPVHGRESAVKWLELLKDWKDQGSAISHQPSGEERR